MAKDFGCIAVDALAVLGIAMVTPRTVPMADAALIDILGLFGSENPQTKVTLRKVEL